MTEDKKDNAPLDHSDLVKQLRSAPSGHEHSMLRADLFSKAAGVIEAMNEEMKTIRRAVKNAGGPGGDGVTHIKRLSDKYERVA